MNTSKPALTWTMKRDGAWLMIRFELTNPTTKPIYLVDRLVVPAGNNKWTTTDKIVVMNDQTPRTVMFALAAVSSDMPSATVYTPTYRELAAGATFKGSLKVPFPLKSWNPVGGANAIAASATSAVLFVDYFAGPPPRWRSLATAGQSPLKVPSGFTPIGVVGAALPLPTR